VTIEIHNAKNIQRDKPLRVLLYGSSKVGKTFLCSGLPDPIFLAPSVEGGIRTLQGMDIPYIDITLPQDVEDAYKLLLGPKARKAYKTVIIDSLTFMQNNVYMPEILRVHGTTFPDMRDWGQLLENMRQLTRQMADLPYDVWFTCLEEEKENEAAGEILTRPLLTGKFAGEAPAYCDVVMRLVIDTKKRKVGEVETTRYMLMSAGVPGFGNYVAGDREATSLPPYIKDPTADKVLATIRGTASKKSKKSKKTSKE
jgi:hypothetical protein